MSRIAGRSEGDAASLLLAVKLRLEHTYLVLSEFAFGRKGRFEGSKMAIRVRVRV
jgi:hypothetical protein